MIILVRRSFRKRTMNMEMMKMAATYYFDYGGGRTLSYTYDDKSRTRRS
jgi:hypothetical protein